ncbi:uncharacterized protein LOC131675737 isoform X2 [Phymastichus coffea]|uniref:uncharacterized protein LOC131675737 isoform X2 n=1 Tax=Phymastichus coffea TaxID=108790 RepID=UPI00273CDA22|nr:uncharacterized protein LOC131675737 isoform X2 [Phymastichus coffea]
MRSRAPGVVDAIKDERAPVDGSHGSSPAATMNQLLALSCLLLGFFGAYLDGLAASAYGSGARPSVECPRGSPPSACAKKYLMFPFPRVGRGGELASSPRSRRVIGIVKQPRIGRSDPSLPQPPVGQWIHEADDGQPDSLDSANRRGALAQRGNHLGAWDGSLVGRPAASLWAFLLVAPNLRDAEHAADGSMLVQLHHQPDGDVNDE